MCVITTLDSFKPNYISFLYESMMKWANKYTCQGFMFVLIKLWSFSNEWHTIDCSASGILFCVGLVEGKGAPADHSIAPEYYYRIITVSLMLCLTKNLHGTGKSFLDSYLCVLQGLEDIKKKGVYGSDILRKRRYQPHYIDGEEIKSHFTYKDVGDVDSLCGEI